MRQNNYLNNTQKLLYSFIKRCKHDICHILSSVQTEVPKASEAKVKKRGPRSRTRTPKPIRPGPRNPFPDPKSPVQRPTLRKSRTRHPSCLKRRPSRRRRQNRKTQNCRSSFSINRTLTIMENFSSRR